MPWRLFYNASTNYFLILLPATARIGPDFPLGAQPMRQTSQSLSLTQAAHPVAAAHPLGVPCQDTADLRDEPLRLRGIAQLPEASSAALRLR
jgi:hypothetical protein